MEIPTDLPSGWPREPTDYDRRSWEKFHPGRAKKLLLLMARYHHHVYVVELAPAVLGEPRFVRANPEYRPGMPCVYVGMTGLRPDERFDKHKAGIKANRYVLRYGVRLLPDLYEVYNPMPYRAAQEMEVELGIALREEGYGVWQG